MVDWQFHTVPGWLVGRAHMERAVSYGTNTFEGLSNALESEECIVIILDGNSGIGAHVRRNLCYLICLRHFIR